MTAFTPNSLTIDPPDRPDHLAGAVLHSLSRPIVRKNPWGVLKTLIFGGLSFGLWPMLSWPSRFRDFVVLEQQQMWHVAEWLRLRTGRPEAMQLRDSTSELGFRDGLWVLAGLMAIAVFYVFTPIVSSAPFTPHLLVDVTYRYIKHRWLWRISTADASRAFNTWTVAISVGYFLHWLQVRLHASDMRRFVRRFNALAQIDGFAPIRSPRTGFGFGPLWIIGAIIMVMYGALWGIPMMMAGGLHAAYVNRTSQLTRARIAHQVRDMLMRDRPRLNVPMPMRLQPTCENDQCRAPLPKDARFCPRCGMRAAAGPLDMQG